MAESAFPAPPGSCVGTCVHCVPSQWRASVCSGSAESNEAPTAQASVLEKATTPSSEFSWVPGLGVGTTDHPCDASASVANPGAKISAIETTRVASTLRRAGPILLVWLRYLSPELTPDVIVRFRSSDLRRPGGPTGSTAAPISSGREAVA